MLVAIALSFGFGFIAGIAVLVLWRSGVEALAKRRAIQAELAAMTYRPVKIRQAALWRLKQ